VQLVPHPALNALEPQLINVVPVCLPTSSMHPLQPVYQLVLQATSTILQIITALSVQVARHATNHQEIALFVKMDHS
jgi:hypothetical protein